MYNEHENECKVVLSASTVIVKVVNCMLIIFA